MGWLKRIGSIAQRRQSERDLDDELQHHIELKTRENIEAGMKPDEARYAALRAFGGNKDIVGQRIQLNGTPYDMVGVMPRSLKFPNLWWARTLGERGMIRPPSLRTCSFQCRAAGRQARREP